MKGLVVALTACLVTGCGTYTSMEELEHQALLTGDWSAVERRERMLERRKMRGGNFCPAGQVAVCSGSVQPDQCSCMESEKVLGILAGL